MVHRGWTIAALVALTGCYSLKPEGDRRPRVDAGPAASDTTVVDVATTDAADVSDVAIDVAEAAAPVDVTSDVADVRDVAAEVAADVAVDAGSDAAVDGSIDAAGDRPDVAVDVADVVDAADVVDVPSCAAGTTVCNGRCVTLSTDSSNCGACGARCLGGQRCASSRCDYPPGPQRSCTPTAVPGCGLVAVPGGTFTMGHSSKVNASPEQSMITVSPFALDRYEVTVARFRRFWDDGHPNPAGPVRYPNGVDLPLVGVVVQPTAMSAASTCNWSSGAGSFENYPINCVDWATAQAFCVWDGGRLPTEGEWELAARGTDGRLLPWGTDPIGQQVCWELYNPSPRRPCPEDDPAFAAGESPFGARHMVGNGLEWMADYYAPYGDTTRWGGVPRTDPLVDSIPPTAQRTIRGGAWTSDATENLLTISRGAGTPVNLRDFVSFRCARAAQ